MRTWSEQTASAWINRQPGATVNNKTIFIKKDKGLSGLTGCSAKDYLVNHCGYRTAIATNSLV